MKPAILTVLLVFVVSSACAEINITAAMGIYQTNNNLIEVGTDYQLTEYASLSASVGSFGGNRYIDTGISINTDHVTVGISAAYLYTVPRELTGHYQFKPYAAFKLHDNVHLKYIHFSNGSQIFGWSRYPNEGRDFIGLMWLN